MFSRSQRTTFRRLLQRALPLAALPAALLMDVSRKADAVLVYTFYQDGADVKINASGSLTGLPTFSTCGGSTGASVLVIPSQGRIETALTRPSGCYQLSSGPANFGTGASTGGWTWVGTAPFLFATPKFLATTPLVEGAQISATGTRQNTLLASLGLSSTTPGSILGEWAIGSDKVQVVVGTAPAPPATVPGPLPLFGAAAAFGFSRRLRRRIGSAPSSLTA